MFKKIPEQYLGEFSQARISLIKGRVGLFCVMVVGVYLFANFMNFIVYPKSLEPAEIRLAILLIIVGSIIFYLNNKAHTLRRTKLNAFLFATFLFFIIAKTNLINFSDFKEFSLSIYVFLLFLIGFTIPWSPKDMIPIAFMGVVTYTSLFLYIQNSPFHADVNFSFQLYFQGLMFICMTFCICVIIRIKETERDIENFLLFKRVEKRNTQMQRELELATKVHKTLIPKSINSHFADIGVLYLPAYYLGGDYAKFYFVGKEKLIFIICDVTGHGVSAALLVNRFHIEFERLAQKSKEPAVLLKELNNFILKDFEGTNMYISAFCGMVDFRSKRFTYCNYGHPAQYLYRTGNSEIVHLNSQASLLGITVENGNVQQGRLSFDKGDRIFLFTDGVIETKNQQGQDYERKRLENFARKNHRLQVDLFNQKLLDELSAFKGKKFKDDIFLLTINVK